MFRFLVSITKRKLQMGGLALLLVQAVAEAQSNRSQDKASSFPGALCGQLFHAAATNNLKRIDRILDLEPGLVNQSLSRWTEGKMPGHVRLRLAIHAAAENGNKEAVELLVKRGAKVDIFVASFMGWNDEIRKLVKDDPKVLELAIHHEGIPLGSPLRPAMWKGHESTVKLLLQLGVEPKREPRGTVLEVAVSNDWVEVVKTLLASGIPADERRNDYTVTPLMYARSPAMAELLLKHKADLEAEALGSSPLRSAVRGGRKELVDFFISRGANVNANWPGWCTPLETAYERRRVEIAEQLIKKGAKWTFRAALLAGRTDLVEAYIKDKPELATDSIQFMPPWPGDRIKYSPLGWAAIHGHVDLCRFLLKQPFNPKEVVYPWAQPRIVELLLTTKTKQDIVTPNLRGVVLDTCEHGTEETVRVYIKHGVFDGRNGVPQASWDEAIVAAAGAGKLANVKALYEIKPKSDISQTLARALYQAVVYNCSEWKFDRMDVIHFLVKEKAPVNYRWLPKAEIIGADDSRFAIHVAAEHGSIDAVKLLLDAGATINDKDGEGRTALDHAIVKDRVALVEWLFKNTKLRENLKLKDGWAFPQSPEMLEVLLKNGWIPVNRDKWVDTALHNAIDRKDEIMARMLLDALADVNAPGNYQKTPLFTAVESGNYRLVDLLLKHKARPNEGDFRGDTPLHLAATRFNLPVVKLLLNNGADPNAKNKSDLTPFEAASKEYSNSPNRGSVLEILRKAAKQ